MHLLKWKGGNVVVGTKAPLIITSRTDSFETKLNSIILSRLYYEYLSNKTNK